MANMRTAPYSSVAAALSRACFTVDAAVIASCPTLVAVEAAFWQALVDQLVVDGLDLSVLSASLPELILAVESVVDGLDLSNLPAAYMLVAANLYAKEPGGGPGVPAADVRDAGWAREVTMGDLSSLVTDGAPPGVQLYRLSHYGKWQWHAFSSFLSAPRDLPGMPHRTFIADVRTQAFEAGFKGAAPTPPGPFVPARQPLIARAVTSYFRASCGRVCDWLMDDNGDRADVLRRKAAFDDSVMLNSSFAAQVRLMLPMRLFDLGGFTSLHSLLAPRPPSDVVNVCLDAASGSAFRYGSLADLHRLDDMAALHLGEIDACADATTALLRCKRLSALVRQEADAVMANKSGGGGGGGGAPGSHFGGGGAPGSSDATRELAAAFRRATFLTMRAAVIAECSAAIPDSRKISNLLVHSDIHLCRRFGMGFPVDIAKLPSNQDLFRKAKKHVDCWEKNLSRTLIDLDGIGRPLSAKASGYRCGKAFADKVRQRRLVGVNFEDLAYEIKGAIDDTTYAAVPYNLQYLDVQRNDVIIKVAHRLAEALGDPHDQHAHNSLPAGFWKLREFVDSLSSLPMGSRVTYEASAQKFVATALASFTEEHESLNNNADPLAEYPQHAIPADSACWSDLNEVDETRVVTKKMHKAHPELFSRVGLSTTSLTAPPGVPVPSASSATDSPDRQRKARPGSPAPPGFGGTNLLGEQALGSKAASLIFGARGSFKYSAKESRMYEPERMAKDLGVGVDDYDWAVVCSRQRSASARAAFCTSPGCAGCTSADSYRHLVPERLPSYLAQRGFEGDQPTGGAGRHRSPSERDGDSDGGGGGGDGDSSLERRGRSLERRSPLQSQSRSRSRSQSQSHSRSRSRSRSESRPRSSSPIGTPNGTSSAPQTSASAPRPALKPALRPGGTEGGADGERRRNRRRNHAKYGIATQQERRDHRAREGRRRDDDGGRRARREVERRSDERLEERERRSERDRREPRSERDRRRDAPSHREGRRHADAVDDRRPASRDRSVSRDRSASPAPSGLGSGPSPSRSRSPSERRSSSPASGGFPRGGGGAVTKKTGC
jgi:hypothetical protein